MTDFTESYATNLLRGILSYAHGREAVAVCRMPPSYKREHGLAGVVDWIKKWGGEAIIGQFDPDDDVSLFRQNGIVALAQDYKDRLTDIPNITGDYRGQGVMAADYFLSRGFRHFAFFGYGRAVWCDERYEGFASRLRSSGKLESLVENRMQTLDSLWYYDADNLISWLGSLPAHTALFACDDTCANKIIDACQIAGIKVPQRVAVLGVDNDEITCGLSYPTLSSLRLDIFHGGYAAAKLINQMINTHAFTGPDIVVEAMDIVERGSTSVFATDDECVLRVIRYIEEHLEGSLSVSELLKTVPLSRRLLEMRFRQETGLGLHQFVIEMRMRRLAHLLVSTRDSVADLAMHVGYTDAKNLSRQFKRYSGFTPQNYRIRHREK